MSKTVTAQIIKSSNDLITQIPVGAYYNSGIIYTYLEAPMVSNLLYCAGPANNLKKMALAWDSSVVPENKRILNVTLYVYTLNGHSKNIFYKYSSFNEGSNIPSFEPASGTITGGATGGWKAISLGATQESSVIIGAELNYKTIYVTISPQETIPLSVVDYWCIYSHRSTVNKPYVVIEYDDIPPEPPKSLYPSNTIISARDIIKFAWSHSSKEGLSQTGFTLQYSINGGTSWTNIIQTSSNQYYDMPANTLPTSGNVTWRVKTRDSNGAESEFATAFFTLGIPPQKSPVLVTPIGQYVENSKPIRFEWVFLGGSDSETQSKYNLQYSMNGGADWTTLTETTFRTYREIPANTLVTGNVVWRVQTYNNWNEASDYSDIKSFTVIGSPSVPLISTITNTARPIISWQSTGQHIYEIQILQEDNLLLDSGAIPSTNDKSFKVTMFLDDGQYKVRLRIANEYNLFSDWMERQFEISTIKPNKPDIEVFSERYFVLISSFSEHDTYVYRDGLMLGKTKDGKFFDYTCQNRKDNRYFVRAVEDDTFSDSDIMVGLCDFEGYTLSLAANPSYFLKLQDSLDKELTESGSFGIVGSLQSYDGRSYPVAEYSYFNTEIKNHSFFLSSYEEVETLKGMIQNGEIFLLRGKRNIYGAIFSMEYESNIFGYEIKFTIEKTEWSEDDDWFG